MNPLSNFVTLHPYFKVHPGELESFKAAFPAFIEKTAAEEKNLFYGFTINGDEVTLRENNAGWERLKLYYRVLAGVGERDMTTTVLGQPISMPIVVAPTAF